MQPDQTSSSSSSSSGGSSASYMDNVIVNQRRRFELLTAEAPELDFATRESLSKTVASDSDMIQMARSSISFAMRENTINELKSKSAKEQRSSWEKMSESRKQFLVDAGYTVPEKKKAQWVSWWEYPQHYAAEYIAKGWDYSGADTKWRETLGKPVGWAVKNVASPVLGAVANAGDDIAARPIRAWYDSLGQNELARWQISMEATKTELKKQGMNLSDEEWQQMLWRYTEDNLGELTFLGSSNTHLNPVGVGSHVHPLTMIPNMLLEGISAIPGLGFLENIPGIQEGQYQTRKVNPYSPSITGADVDDATYQKFSDMAGTIQDMEQFKIKSGIDQWNRVDNGIATPDQQLKILRENFDNNYTNFDIALWESEGKSLEDYLKEKEKLDPSSVEFRDRFTELQTNVLSKTAYNDGLNRLKSDNAKISLGRIAARGLGVMNVPYLGDFVSGTVDATNVMILDPLNLAGPAFKWTRFARFGIAAKEIAAARAFDKAIKVTRAGSFFNIVKDINKVAAGEEVLDVVKVFDDAADLAKFQRAQKLLNTTEKLTEKLDAAGVNLDDGIFAVDADGMPTPWLLDNWTEINQAVKETSDELVRDVIRQTGGTPEDIANAVQRGSLKGTTGEVADRTIRIYNQIEALDYLQTVLRYTEAPITDTVTGGKIFNWMAKSSLRGTRNWMDRVVQGFIDLESGTDAAKDALMRLADDLQQGRRIIAPLADYHNLLKSRGFKGITSRDDLWSWLESAGLYHMNVGDITGQISRGFGNGIKLPSQFRVFGRLADTLPTLENRSAVGMLPRLSKGGMRRRALINKTERAMYAVTKRTENESLLKRIGMFAPRSAAKFTFSLSHHIPENSYLNLTGDDAVVEFGRLLDYGFFAGVDKAILDEFMEQFIRGTSSGTRVISDMSRTQINQRIDSYIRMIADPQLTGNMGHVLSDDAQYAVQTAVEQHPVIRQIRDQLGISQPFKYRESAGVDAWTGLNRPESVAHAFEWGWSDEVLERWDEVSSILDQQVPNAVSTHKQVLQSSYDLVDELNTSVANYAHVYGDPERLISFVRAVGNIANDMGLEVDEVMELHKQYLRDLFNNADFRSELYNSLDLNPDRNDYLWSALVDSNSEVAPVETWINLFLGDSNVEMITKNSLKELEPLTYQNSQDMFTEILKSYRRESIFNSTTASRIMVEKQFLHELFNKAGMYTSEEGRAWADQFLNHLEGFRYAPNGEDEFALKTLSGDVQKIRVGVLPYSHRSRAMAIPAFQSFVDAMDKIGLTGRFTRRLNRSFIDAAMTQIWKPLTLMRLGFIPRAAGEEYLAFYARRGIWAPIASIASNIGPDRRGAILGSINHIGSLPSRVIARLNQKGWGGAVASVSEVLKYKNQADYMEYIASLGRISPRRLNPKLTGEMLDSVELLARGEKVTLQNVVNSSLAADWAKSAGRIMSNNFDYLRAASEYHTAKVAASIKSFNFSKMPQHLQRAILAEMGMSGRADFADQLGLIDHYAVTAALQDDADKLMRTAYMQQAHADAQAGVGGMIADPVLRDETQKEVLRLKRSSFSKTDDVVVEVNADRDWVSVDPTQLQDDGLYLAAGQQGSLIDNDPIAMEAVRTLANRIHERRLAMNYQALKGTQWDVPLMDVIDVPFGVDDVLSRLVELGADSGRASDFVLRLRENPARVLFSLAEDSSNMAVTMEAIEQRALVSAYFDELTPSQIDSLFKEFIEVSSERDVELMQRGIQRQLEYGNISIEDADKAMGWLADGTWREHIGENFDLVDNMFSEVLAKENGMKGTFAGLANVELIPDNEFDRLALEVYDPSNPYYRDPNAATQDVLDTHLKELKNNIWYTNDRGVIETTDLGEKAAALDTTLNKHINNPELANEFGTIDEIQTMEDSIKYADPNFNAGTDPFASPIVDGELQSEGVAAEVTDEVTQAASEARDFFNGHLFRVVNTADQYYIDSLGNLHLVANRSGRNASNIISTMGPRTENFVAESNTVTGFFDYWGGVGEEGPAVIAIQKDKAKFITGGAGADNPGDPFEIELLADSTGEVVLKKGEWKIFYKPKSASGELTPQEIATNAYDRLDRSMLINELNHIVDGTLAQENSVFFQTVTPEMQYYINKSRIQGSLVPPMAPHAVEQFNVGRTLDQFELIRSSIQNLPEKDRRLLEAAMQADQIAAGKSLPDSILASYDLTNLHPEVRHQIDYMAEGSHYAKAVARAMDLAESGDSTMLEALQVLTTTNRDVAQVLLGRNPLQLADEAGDIVDAEAAVLRALQSPEHAAVVNDSFLAMFDEASGLGVASPVTKYDRPIYSVMVDTWTAKWIERTLGSIGHSAEDMRGLDTILNMLRVKGASDDDLELIQRVLLGFDDKHVSGAVKASNNIYRSTMVPISTTAFTNVQDAQRAVELLTDLSPAAGEYRQYLGFGSRPNTKTYAKIGGTIVPAENGNILNAVYSDDLRTLTFDPNFQHNIDRVAPLAEAENLIHYNELGEVVPAGEFAVEGIPREIILREYARRIVSTVLGFVQSRDGRLLHELIGPMDRGVWGVDAMYHVPKSELPSKIIYRTPYVSPATGKWATATGKWADFISRGFTLMNKAIYSISRAPQFMLGLADGLAMAREITDVLRDTELDSLFDDVLRKVNPVSDKALQDILVRETRRDLQNSWSMIGEAATSELNDGAEMMDELLGLVADGRLDPTSPILELSGKDLDTAFDWIRLDHHLERLEMQRGLDRAVAETVPYIDDHNVRSFFQVYAKNLFPFQFAQEAFLKRWARTVVYSPESFRRIQLLVHSLQSSGFVHEDPVSGQMTFNFPLTESLEDLILSNPASKMIFGDAARFPVANPLTGKVENVLPGVPSDFQNLPQASPIAMIPLVGLAAHFPEIKPLVSMMSGGRAIDTSGAMPTIETILSQWVPANYLRMYAAVTGNTIGFTKSELHQNTISAMAQMESEAIRLRAELETVEDPKQIEEIVDKINLLSPPVDASDVELQQHVDEMQKWARMNMMFRAALGWFMPTSGKNEFEGIELSKEYGDLLRYMPAEDALAAFLTEHPDAQPWTIFQTEKTTAAELAPTDRALNWMNENREFMDTYTLAGPWFMPQSQADDEYSQQAYVDMVAAGMKKFKLPIEWYKDLKYAAAANIYFPSKVRKDSALENAVSSEDKKNIENKWTLWSDEFKRQHPIFTNMMNESINSKSTETLNELYDLVLLDDSELPKSDHINEIRTMVQAWKTYDASMSRIKGLSSKDIRLQREALRTSFLMWGQSYVFENASVRTMWNSLVLPATDLVSESRSLFGKD